ncbi:MAG: amino acid ABC transporter substrate-binding protein [Chloroflexi bacterium]|nr:amino acid ABC transporter substrate-binding protein [Chloroflexota bacterium]
MRSRHGVAAVLTAAALLAAACSNDPSEATPEDAGTPPGAGATGTTEATGAGRPAAVEAGDASADQGPEPVRIGVIMATGGRLAPHDGPVLDAFAYAVRQVNSSGGLLGRPLELLFEDSDSELNTAFEAARRLVDREVDVFFASCDPYFNRPVREVAHGAGVLVIVPFGPEPWPTVASGRDRVFSAGTSARAYGRALAEYAAEAGFGSVATLVEGDKPEAVEMCDNFDRRFAELGGSSGFTLRFDRFWIAAQPVVGAQATARALEAASRHPAVVICAAVGGRGTQMFELLRSAGVANEVLAPAALDGVAWQHGVFGLEPLTVITESSTFGDDPSTQVNAYFASIITGDLRRTPADPDQNGDPRALATVEDRVGWAVTGAEALWIFLRAVQRTASFDAGVLAADIEQFQNVDLWMDSASFSPARHAVGGRALRVIRHDGGASRLVELRIPSG